MDPKIIAVLIGVIGALLGVYAKEYLQSQFKKRRSITILKANLFLFLHKVQDNEHLNKLLMAGSILDDRYIKSLVSGDDSKYKELLDQINSIEEHAKTDELLTDDAVDEMCAKIKSASKREIDITFEEIDRLREDIEHGTYILGSSELDFLDSDMVHRVLQVKRSVNDILISIKVGIAGVYEREEVDRELVKSLILGAIKESVMACRHIIPLMKMCNERSQ
jgi:anti-sigma28 factor (negative regulator of flagellin synthesis)